MSTCMLLMVAFGTLAPSTDSYRTTVFGLSSVAGLASIGSSMRQLTLFCLQCEANSGIHTKRPIAKDGPEDHESMVYLQGWRRSRIGRTVVTLRSRISNAQEQSAQCAVAGSCVSTPRARQRCADCSSRTPLFEQILDHATKHLQLAHFPRQQIHFSFRCFICRWSTCQTL